VVFDELVELDTHDWLIKLYPD